MKKILIISFFVLISSTFVFGKFLILPIEERVKENNLIVIGKLQDVSETETDMERISKGTLVVEKIIYGRFKNSNGQKLKLGDKVQIEWTNSKIIACKFGFTENKSEIWFLNVNDEGRIESLSPSTTASLDDLTKVKKYLKKLKKENKIAKSIIIQDDFENRIQPKPPVQTSTKTVRYVYLVSDKPKTYSPFSAFLVILISISLYYLLYRSRFKIR